MTIEYAWFLADTRGIGFALEYLDNCHVPRAIVTRALGHPELRRSHDRRAAARADASNDAGCGGGSSAVG